MLLCMLLAQVFLLKIFLREYMKTPLARFLNFSALLEKPKKIYLRIK